jgi:hypothetical protein
MARFLTILEGKVQERQSSTFSLVSLSLSLSLSLSSSSEIPQYRLPYDVVSYEVELMKDLGVKVHVHHKYL